jgi:hypothetical protein
MSTWLNVARSHLLDHFFTTLTVEGLTGILAAVALAFLACGFATTRRAAV